MAAFMKRLNMIVRAYNVYRGTRVTSEGLHGAHHSYAWMILNHPGMSQEALGEALCTSKSTVTRVLTHLEQHGYVERRVSESDRRIQNVYPTERLTALVPELRAAARAWNEYLFADMSEEERTAFDAILARVTERAGNYIGGKDGPAE